jgi:hypothetical protein
VNVVFVRKSPYNGIKELVFSYRGMCQSMPEGAMLFGDHHQMALAVSKLAHRHLIEDHQYLDMNYELIWDIVHRLGSVDYVGEDVSTDVVPVGELFNVVFEWDKIVGLVKDRDIDALKDFGASVRWVNQEGLCESYPPEKLAPAPASEPPAA